MNENGQFEIDSTGCVKLEWGSKDDLRDVRDGDIASKFETDYPLPLDTTGMENLENYKDEVTNVLAPRITKNTRVYKGGSWADRIYWLNPSTRRYMEQDQASSKIGFRCAMSSLGNQIPGTPVQ